jgi:hypothetical protein
MKPKMADMLMVGDYIRWLKPLGNSVDRGYIYGIITSIVMTDTNEQEPKIKILDTKTQKDMWLPLRLLVELGDLQIASENGWTKVLDRP